MTLQGRPSAFSESPEELVERARRWRSGDTDPIETAVLIRELAGALAKERMDRATSASLLRAANLDAVSLRTELQVAEAARDLAQARAERAATLVSRMRLMQFATVFVSVLVIFVLSLLRR
jgi:hypothetical protein